MFICMFVGLPSWVSVVCGLIVCWLKNVPFSFLLVSPFPALSEHCFVQMLVCSLGGNVSKCMKANTLFLILKCWENGEEKIYKETH